MRKLKTPAAVNIAILTVITIFIWIGLDVYRTLTTKPEPEVTPAVLEPINPNLDMNTFSSIERRTFLEGTEAGTTVIRPASDDGPSLPTPSPTISPSPSPSVSPSPSPTT